MRWATFGQTFFPGNRVHPLPTAATALVISGAWLLAIPGLHIPKLRVAGSHPVSRSSFRGDDEGFRGDPGALRLSGSLENLARYLASLAFSAKSQRIPP